MKEYFFPEVYKTKRKSNFYTSLILLETKGLQPLHTLHFSDITESITQSQYSIYLKRIKRVYKDTISNVVWLLGVLMNLSFGNKEIAVQIYQVK